MKGVFLYLSHHSRRAQGVTKALSIRGLGVGCSYKGTTGFNVLECLVLELSYELAL